MNYKNTLNLPQTDFPMQAKLHELEPRILDLWKKEDIYSLSREKSRGLPKFILHDGPPYANGDIHIGHALNKILKDFVVKYKIMRGYDVPFVPGWDCHGLPVELQLLKELGIAKHQVDKVEFRKKARDFALRFVNIQREQFKRLGLIADWDKPYLTLDFAYEGEIVRAFAKLVKDKYIYHGLKPINWCLHCETALAEAEVEYEDHRSPSVFVKFQLPNSQKALKNLLKAQDYNKVSFLIWTTTPWTLLSNVAIALHPEFTYELVEVSSKEGAKEILIMAEDLVNSVIHHTETKEYRTITQIKGKRLENLKANHPFIGRISTIVMADYVSSAEGTGCVHTAPGHGAEDYATGLKYKLPVIMPVDEKGKFDATCEEFSGMGVFDANRKVIDKMKGNGSLFYATDTLHSYPHCWRCKNPLITRSTKQWFVDVGHKGLREKALKLAKKVQWIPEGSRSRIVSMIEGRPDWCLSRQRFWGVPIPVFYCASCGKDLLDFKIMERVANIVSESGSDAWFTKSTEELLGKKMCCSDCGAEEFVKEEDIIDVWFDSGVSHQAVLTRDSDLKFPASLYLEGSDQHRGWFQTALLTSIPLTGKAPYKQVLTHGFTVDGEGKKMSKSRGNVITPDQIMEKYGTEILRLWVASCDYGDDVRISPQILVSIADGYRKIRNTLRFLLGNLYDFTPDKKLKYDQLQEIDKWALSSLTHLLQGITDDFERFQYYKAYRKLYNFCVNEMSSFYLDILKDRLYTFGKESIGRRSAQTVIAEILSVLTKLLAPILNFTAEEIWQHLSKIIGAEDTPLVVLNRWPNIERKWIKQALDEKMHKLSKIRNVALKAIENEREKGLIKSSLESKVCVYTTEEDIFKFLQDNIKLLPAVFIVSDVSVERIITFEEGMLKGVEVPHLAVLVEKIDFPKCQRCWNYRAEVGKNSEHPVLCARCVEVIKASGSTSRRLGEGRNQDE